MKSSAYKKKYGSQFLFVLEYVQFKRLMYCSYEKLISGMYLGEIARRLILICTEKGLLFNGTVTEELCTADRFYTKYLSEVAK